MLWAILGRDAPASGDGGRADVPDSPAAVADHLARMKRDGAVDYAAGLELGMTAADDPFLRL